MSLESYVLKLQKETNPGAVEGALQSGLSALESVYIRGAAARRVKETAHAVHAGIPVVSVGNITAGGTGKTPCIIGLAETCLSAGLLPAIISRGYKSELEKTGGIVSDGRKILLSQRQAGDEPYMMAQKLPGVPILIGKDRLKSAAAAKGLGAQILLLDDGFQYWKLARDLDIVLIDATDPFGGGRVLPRGLLREPKEALSRAGFFFLTKAGQVTEEAREDIKKELAYYAPGVPVVCADHAPATLTALSDWPETVSLAEAEKGTAFLLSGIGNPAAFRKTAEEAGLKVLGMKTLPDHAAYTKADVANAVSEAKKHGAASLVITEKDAVKIKENIALSPEDAAYIKILGIEMKETGGASPFGEILKFIKKSSRSDT